MLLQSPGVLELRSDSLDLISLCCEIDVWDVGCVCVPSIEIDILGLTRANIPLLRGETT